MSLWIHSHSHQHRPFPVFPLAVIHWMKKKKVILDTVFGSWENLTLVPLSLKSFAFLFAFILFWTLWGSFEPPGGEGLPFGDWLCLFVFFCWIILKLLEYYCKTENTAALEVEQRDLEGIGNLTDQELPGDLWLMQKEPVSSRKEHGLTL